MKFIKLTNADPRLPAGSIVKVNPKKVNYLDSKYGLDTIIHMDNGDTIVVEGNVDDVELKLLGEYKPEPVIQ